MKITLSQLKKFIKESVEQENNKANLKEDSSLDEFESFDGFNYNNDHFQLNAALRYKKAYQLLYEELRFRRINNKDAKFLAEMVDHLSDFVSEIKEKLEKEGF